MRAIGYVRVSTESQAADGVSLDAQQARIAAWCVANGAELAGVHIDAGISGGRADNRPGLQEALDDVCSGGGVLVVYSLSRLARSTRDTIAIAERLDKAGADLASLSERIDTTTAAGKMLFRLLAVLAEFERDLISERTLGAMSYKRSMGERIGTIPLGFVLAEDGRTLHPDDAEQRAILTIRDLSTSGLGLRAIARELDRLEVPTKTGRAGWTHSAVAKVLGRPDTASRITHAPSAPNLPHVLTPRSDHDGTEDAAHSAPTNRQSDVL
jgi:site-specific DNA recombinase